MPPLVRQILLTLLGIIVGAMTNMATLKAGMMVVPFPAGFDPNTPEGIEGAMQQFTVANFIVPFLAPASNRWSGLGSGQQRDDGRYLVSLRPDLPESEFL